MSKTPTASLLMVSVLTFHLQRTQQTDPPLKEMTRVHFNWRAQLSCPLAQCCFGVGPVFLQLLILEVFWGIQRQHGALMWVIPS